MTKRHSQIFNHWKDKCIDYMGRIHIEGEFPYGISVPVVNDWGEPQCWGCGRIICAENNKNYDKCLNSKDFNEFIKIWDFREVTSKLDRAHIIPDSLGGEPVEDNLFLLCHRCHQDSPDINNKQLFLKWIYHKRKNPSVEVNCVIKALNILSNEYNIKFPYIDDPGIIWDTKSNIGTHGGRVSDDTMTYAVINNAIKNQTTLRSDVEMLFRNAIYEKISMLNESDDADKITAYQEALRLYDEMKKIEQQIII